MMVGCPKSNTTSLLPKDQFVFPFEELDELLLLELLLELEPIYSPPGEKPPVLALPVVMNSWHPDCVIPPESHSQVHVHPVVQIINHVSEPLLQRDPVAGVVQVV
jgi:hypothetical protein